MRTLFSFKRLWKKIWITLSKNESARERLAGSKILARAVKRFVAGEDFEQAKERIGALRHSGLKIVLDLLGENVFDVEHANKAVNDYCELLEKIRDQGCDTTIAVKLTQIGLSIGSGVCEANLEKILKTAGNCNLVEIDMEGSDYTADTLTVFKKLRSNYVNLGVTLQVYLYRTEKDMSDLLYYAKKENAILKVRLVKGAYDEPSGIAFTHIKDINRNYVKSSKFLFDNRKHFYPAIATHNTALIEHAKTLSTRLGKDLFEFQMLLGVRPQLQRRLAAEGFNVRIYVPFGRAWYPYLMRRIGERPANGLFLLKQLFLN